MRGMTTLKMLQEYRSSTGHCLHVRTDSCILHGWAMEQGGEKEAFSHKTKKKLPSPCESPQTML